MAPQANEDIKRRGGAAKDAVGDFVHRLRADRANRALRLVLLREAGDNGDLYLAPADARHMILLLSTDGGNEMRVLAVRHGALARDELSRLTVEINPVSGAVEVIDQSEVSVNVVALPDRSRSAVSTASVVDATFAVTPSPSPSATEEVGPDPAEPSRTPLFAGHDDKVLAQLGVVPSLLPTLKSITTEEQFEALLTHNLPELTRDVLLALHDGMRPQDVRHHITDMWRPDEPVNPHDWARAAQRAVSQAETEDDAVLSALGESFDAWRLFLHPEQHRLATGDFKGSAKVTGGPGTGKTVVALHRVRHLVKRLSTGHSRPVLLVTYNTNLAMDLRARLRQLGGDELLRRVDVKSVDALAHEIVQESRGTDPGQPLSEDAAKNLWHTVRTETGLFDYDADFLDAEFKHVILAQGCGSWELYRRVGRSGRPRISTAQRHDVWQLVQAYKAHLEAPPRQTTYALIADRAAGLEAHRMARVEAQVRHKDEQGGRDLVHREAGSGMWLKPRYQHIVVDEAQDLSASHWRMLRAMVPKGRNDIFLVGDAHQRIYGHHVVLGHQGIEIRGRASRRLTLNYRTTRQILDSANRMIAGATFDNLDDGTDTLDGYRSVLTGLVPQFWRAPDSRTEMRAVAALIKERHDTYDTPYSAMAISVPDGASAQQFANVLARKPFFIPTVEVDKGGLRSDADAVRIGTMHRFKGLEFQRVFLTSVSEGQVPHQRIEQYQLANPDRYRQEEQRARSLMFVAATRARDELIITWSGKASRFLPQDSDRTAHSATELLRDEGPPSGSSGSSAA
ncbi:ATP-dependent helicase [Streptomyces malaysiensis subsp. malaysiensis]|uniref:UvrD-helicase domain-containing protein n=1 Tax=Streptomyces malaysiensis TaxID=92644 RepID=UPI000BFD78F7|nr:UvrD-helicase domain-containing protein [Streptomyces malaysiensis]QDL73803.1 ATP-dependent helicase [Streptomyces malaysiensis]